MATDDDQSEKRAWPATVRRRGRPYEVVSSPSFCEGIAPLFGQEEANIVGDVFGIHRQSEQDSQRALLID